MTFSNVLLDISCVEVVSALCSWAGGHCLEIAADRSSDSFVSMVGTWDQFGQL